MICIKNKPKVTVVIPVFNCEKYVSMAIESILNQTYKDFELIIVDDGSTDASLCVIESFKDPRIYVISRENRGLAQTMNDGIRAGCGEYIAQMDADDISDFERLAKQVEFLDQNVGFGLVGTWAVLLTEDGEELCIEKKPFDRKSIERYLDNMLSPFIDPSVMFRRSLFDVAGSYDSPYQDTGLFSSWGIYTGFAKYSKLTNLPLPLYYYRLRPTSNTFTFKRKQNRFKILKHKKLLNEATEPSLSFSQTLNASDKLSHYYLNVGVKLIEHCHDHKKARWWIKKSLSINRLILKSWVNLIYTFFPADFAKYLKLKWKNFVLNHNA